MSALLGLAVIVLALIGTIRVLRAIALGFRRTVAAVGRAMVAIGTPPAPTVAVAPPPVLEFSVPADDTIAQIASLAHARAKRAAKAARS